MKETAEERSDAPLPPDTVKLLTCVRSLPQNYQMPVLLSLLQIPGEVVLPFLHLSEEDFALLQERGKKMLDENLAAQDVALSGASHGQEACAPLAYSEAHLRRFMEMWRQHKPPTACELFYLSIRKFTLWCLASGAIIYFFLWFHTPRDLMAAIHPLFLGAFLSLLAVIPLIKCGVLFWQRLAVRRWRRITG
jgi:hypothetical protein